MALFFGDCAHSIHKIQGLFEIGKAKLPIEMMFAGNGPGWDAVMQFLEIDSFERGNSTTAGNALLVGKLLGHDSTMVHRFVRAAQRSGYSHVGY